ncbi:Plant intracellular Ras-group-related LRR protein 2 [Diplonema papillatum]|nr:Plant intracellular Ras-group-related LRR protein 2 [Diplonema papillatum]
MQPAELPDGLRQFAVEDAAGDDKPIPKAAQAVLWECVALSGGSGPAKRVPRGKRWDAIAAVLRDTFGVRCSSRALRAWASQNLPTASAARGRARLDPESASCAQVREEWRALCGLGQTFAAAAGLGLTGVPFPRLPVERCQPGFTPGLARFGGELGRHVSDPRRRAPVVPLVDWCLRRNEISSLRLDAEDATPLAAVDVFSPQATVAAIRSARDPAPGGSPAEPTDHRKRIAVPYPSKPAPRATAPGGSHADGTLERVLVLSLAGRPVEEQVPPCVVSCGADVKAEYDNVVRGKHCSTSGSGAAQAWDAAEAFLVRRCEALWNAAVLSSVRQLDVSANRVGHVSPRFIACMASLETLRLDGNQLEDLPDDFGSCLARSLRVLDLSFNRLRCLPASFAELGRLVEFRVANNRLAALPPQFAQRLSRLKWLDISSNAFAADPLPEAPAECTVRAFNNPFR